MHQNNISSSRIMSEKGQLWQQIYRPCVYHMCLKSVFLLTFPQKV